MSRHVHITMYSHGWRVGFLTGRTTLQCRIYPHHDLILPLTVDLLQLPQQAAYCPMWWEVCQPTVKPMNTSHNTFCSQLPKSQYSQSNVIYNTMMNTMKHFYEHK